MEDTLWLIADILDFFVNVIEFVAIFVAFIGILIIFSSKYTRPLTEILKPLGLRYKNALRVLIISRKEPKIHIRFFIEFSIIESKGKYCTPKEWKQLINDFEYLLKNSKDEYIISLNNCTALVNEDINNNLEVYYQYFNKRRQRFAIPEKEVFPYIAQVSFRQGFLSSYFLVGGLLDKFENNWDLFLKKYLITAQEKQDLLHGELYFLFVWLLWGPSYRILNREGYIKIFQYSFGDEANSITTFIEDHNNNDELWNLFVKNKHAEGVLCSITCNMFYKKEFINSRQGEFYKDHNYLLNKIYHSDNTDIVLSICDIKKAPTYIEGNYSTAYIWIVFESFIEESDTFQADRVLSFFEHANISDLWNYTFLTDTLLSKCFAHFDIVFSDEDYADRKYRYCISMNEDIEDAFYRKLEQKITDSRNEGADTIALGYETRMICDNKYSSVDIFNSLDNYFSTIDSLKYSEIDINDPSSMEDFGRFFSTLYIQTFPDPNERETYENMLLSLTQKHSDFYGNNNYHIVVVKDSEDKIVGGAICDYFSDSNSGVIEFILMGKTRESAGLGTQLYNHILEVLNMDARKNNHKSLSYIICEIENPDTVPETYNMRYLYFWNKLFFRKINMQYIQPALDSNKEEVNTLLLIAFSIKDHENNFTISKKTVKSFIHDYAKYAMRIDNPLLNKTVIKMYEDLDTMPEKLDTKRLCE
jgi:hypothetical protein